MLAEKSQKFERWINKFSRQITNPLSRHEQAISQLIFVLDAKHMKHRSLAPFPAAEGGEIQLVRTLFF